MADNVELYDIPPVFQNRLLKWLDKHGERLTIQVVDEKFVVTPREPRGGSSQHKSLEHALNHAMGSRAETGHINTRFATKVKKWLAAENARWVIGASGDLFMVELVGENALSRDEDEDLEVALVLAEEQYLSGSPTPASRAETVAAPTLRDVEPMTLEARTRYDVEPETIEAPTRFRIGDDDKTIREAGLTENARWSRAYINSLPDSAFLYVEPGGKRDRIGRSHPLTLRHLPYKNRSGRIDKAHLHAAMSRAHQDKTKLPAATKERLYRRAEEIYRREFGEPERMAANAPPRRRERGSSLRGRELPSARTIMEREEARQRRETRPFEPEERREQYAKPHHFAVNDRRRRRKSTTVVPYADAFEELGGYPYAKSETGRYVLFRDDREVMRGTEQEIWKSLHAHPYSVEHALRYEGYRIEPEVPLAPNAADAPRHPPREDILRTVALDDTGYRLQLWDTHRTDHYGKSILGYAFSTPERTTLFVGEDFAASPMDAIDSDETARGLLGFLTLRPGDTDPEYFESYTPEQMAFAEGPAEELQMFGMEADGEFEPPPLVDV